MYIYIYIYSGWMESSRARGGEEGRRERVRRRAMEREGVEAEDSRYRGCMGDA